MRVDQIKEYELWYSYVEIFTFEVTFKNEIGLHEGINMLCLIEFVLMHQPIGGMNWFIWVLIRYFVILAKFKKIM